MVDGGKNVYDDVRSRIQIPQQNTRKDVVMKA
jgi:hypothetical protein